MMRLLMFVPLLAVGLAKPTAAQQISEPEARQVGERIVAAFNTAFQRKDAAAIAALYADDAIIVVPAGPHVGRAAIERDWKEIFKVYSPNPSELDQVKVIDNGVMVRSGRWSGTIQGAKGPVQLKGYWTTTDVLDGGAWRIRMETDNMIPSPSVPEQKN